MRAIIRYFVPSLYFHGYSLLSAHFVCYYLVALAVYLSFSLQIVELSVLCFDACISVIIMFSLMLPESPLSFFYILFLQSFFLVLFVKSLDGIFEPAKLSLVPFFPTCAHPQCGHKSKTQQNDDKDLIFEQWGTPF